MRVIRSSLSREYGENMKLTAKLGAPKDPL
jgi:hypothetical protein